jgi:hypothetical protein
MSQRLIACQIASNSGRFNISGVGSENGTLGSGIDGPAAAVDGSVDMFINLFIDFRTWAAHVDNFCVGYPTSTAHT